MITSIDCFGLPFRSDMVCLFRFYNTQKAQGRGNASWNMAANYIDCHYIQGLSKGVSQEHNVFNGNHLQLH